MERHASDPEFVVERSQIEESRSLRGYTERFPAASLHAHRNPRNPRQRQNPCEGGVLLPLGRGHRRGRRRVDGPRARAGHARLPCRAGARPEPVHRLLRVPVLRGPRRRSASTSGPRCSRPNAGDCLRGTAPSKPARSWSPSTGRRRSSHPAGPGVSVLDVADEAGRAREGAAVAELPPRAPAGRQRSRTRGPAAALLERRDHLHDRRGRDARRPRHGRQRAVPSAPEERRLVEAEGRHPDAARSRAHGRRGRSRDPLAAHRRRPHVDLRRDVRRRATSGSPATCSTGRSRTACSRCWRARAAGTSTGSARSTGSFPSAGTTGRRGGSISRSPSTRSTTGSSVDGGFVRDGERLALRDPALLLGRGFLFTRTSMARLELDGGFAWLARLRSVGSDHDPPERIRRAARNARAFRAAPAFAARRAALRGVRRRPAAARAREPARAARTRTRCGRICGRRSCSTTTA